MFPSPPLSFSLCVYVCVCVCVRERERDREREKREREREFMCVPSVHNQDLQQLWMDFQDTRCEWSTSEYLPHVRFKEGIV